MEVAEFTLEHAITLEDECRNTKHTLHRDLLEKKYESLITHNPKLTRTLVSFQANKNTPYYRWFKYKEGQVLFLVEIIEAGDFNQQQARLAIPYRVSSPFEACA